MTTLNAVNLSRRATTAQAQHVDADDAFGNEGRLAHIARHLRIKVLYEDEAVVVIDKPCNLRSVPGHANPPTTTTTTTRLDVDKNDETGRRMTAQEAWISAIRCFRIQTEEVTAAATTDATADRWLQSLAMTTTNLASIPRKASAFRRYCRRNQRRLSSSFDAAKIPVNHDHRPQQQQQSKSKRRLNDKELDSVVNKMHERIRKRQVQFMNLPKATDHEDSAFGQLILLGYASKEETDGDESTTCRKQLYVVHRLDCETSGVMVFARDRESASVLSHAWRERNQVSKQYLARVKHWPPFHEERKWEGRIDEAMVPSDERLKWQVQASGKTSTTLWKVRESPEGRDSLVLELTPVTGRTHQLRVHCAHVGGGIEGDSLYGDERIEWNPDQSGGSNKVLCLHSHQLSFPHPVTGERMEFTTMPSWYNDEASPLGTIAATTT